jgi:outer membrane protein
MSLNVGVKKMKNFVKSALVLTAGMIVMPMTSMASKYGIIDMQAVILNVEEGKQARAELEKKIKAKESEFNKRREELDKMNKDFQGQSALLSEEARLNKQKEFQEKFLAFRNDEMAFRDAVKQDEQKATQGIAAKVEGMVKKLASEKGLDVVFEINNAGLLYLAQPVDLTKDVIANYGKKK